MQIQIKSLEVKNCGPLRDVEIDFTINGAPRPVTVIGGANGSGKTTVMELICALTYLLHGFVPLELSHNKDLRILNRTEAARLKLLVDNVDFSICYGQVFSEDVDYGYLIGNYGEPRFISNGDTEQHLRNAINGQHNQKLPLFSNSSLVSQFQAPSILYFPDYRRLEPVAGQQIIREDILYQWVYRYEVISSFEGSLDSYLVWLDYAYPEQFAELRKFLNGMILADKAINSVNRPELTTMVKLANGQTHRLDELSSGEQNLLIIMLELRRRLLPGSIVLIDEIENSLHLAFQHRLAEALVKLQKQIPFQLIVTTHAPSFLDAFGAESTLLLTEF